MRVTFPASHVTPNRWNSHAQIWCNDRERFWADSARWLVLLAAADLDGNGKPDYLQPRHASNSDLVSE
jgi:hypothetical protein